MSSRVENAIYVAIRAALDQRYPGISDREASLRATNGRNPDLLRKLRTQPYASPRGENLAGLARLLGTSADWILSGRSAEKLEEEPAKDVRGNNAANTMEPDRMDDGHLRPSHVPVIGKVGSFESERYSFALMETGEEYVDAPVHLAQVKNLYAAYVNTDEMAPLFQQGQRILVHPGRPVIKGSAILIVNRDQATLLKIFQGFSDIGIVTSTLRHPDPVVFPDQEGQEVHKVLSYDELIG